MADLGEVESPRGESGVEPGQDAADLKAVAASLASLPGPVDFSGVLAIADSLPVMIAYLDRGQRYMFLNRTLAEWLEQPRKSILGRTMRQVIGKKAYEFRKPLIEAAFAGERQWFIADFEHPTRGTLTVQTEYVPHLSPSGEVFGLILVIQDVTEQRAAEMAIRESEARFRRIANSAPVMIWVTRLDRTRDFVNDAYAEFTGLSREEARVLDWRSRIHPDDAERLVAESVAGEASLKPFALEARYLRHDGQWRWLRSVSQPRFGADGKLSGFIGVATDITEQRATEMALRESEARFRQIANTAPVPMWVTGPDGSRDFVNQAFVEFFGFSPDKQGWHDWIEAVHPEDRDQIVATQVEATADLKPYELIGRFRRRDGQWRWVRAVSVPRLDSEGQPIGMVGAASDITEAKEAEIALQRQVDERTAELSETQDQLRQSQKMEALGQLTGGIAHDFNNLLTVVVGGLDLIVKQVQDERLLRFATNALSAAERGARLTAQLLAFSRVQRLEVKPTYVAPLIEEMRPLLRNVLGPGIQKKFDLDPHLTPVLADPTQLEVAVLNLAINARDAMPDGGTLTISSRKRRIGDDPELEPGTYIELSITDTGSGMTPDVQSRAFEPFFTTKEVGRGTGLGLSMVYGMARQCGGGAKIESEPGRGTTVRLYFRRADRDAEVPASGGQSGDELRRARGAATVLVIDDDADVRHFIAAGLEEYGHEVIEAADGTDGIEKFAANMPDLVIIDYIMPGLSGAEVADHILATKADQPILFVSGYNETDAIRRVAPDANILAKPFRAAALEDAVRAALLPTSS
ncbi:MAG: PAS domain S-box protein [Pseudomonadota bacterium]|nr:PAS domain S-box protein [Pseudomonadota bacterium]